MFIIILVGSITACFIRVKIQIFISGRTPNMTFLRGVTVTLKKEKSGVVEQRNGYKSKSFPRFYKRKDYEK